MHARRTSWRFARKTATMASPRHRHSAASTESNYKDVWRLGFLTFGHGVPFQNNYGSAMPSLSRRGYQEAMRSPASPSMNCRTR